MVRVTFTGISPLNLYADEAQYWRWGETLEWGYYSKPPMIAWVIHAVTSVLGNAEWAVRLPAAFLHTAGAVFIYFLARDMYGHRVGMFSSLGYALMPAVILSSVVISTDGVLMPFWCAALWALWRLRNENGGWISAVGLGAAVGFGFLSKYAMLYFAIGTLLVLLLDQQSRRALISFKGLAALSIAAAIFAPHLLWNAANDFKTVSHTVDNANLGGDLINPENALTFLVDQLGVFGPISFLRHYFSAYSSCAAKMTASWAGIAGCSVSSCQSCSSFSGKPSCLAQTRIGQQPPIRPPACWLPLGSLAQGRTGIFGTSLPLSVSLLSCSRQMCRSSRAC